MSYHQVWCGFTRHSYEFENRLFGFPTVTYVAILFFKKGFSTLFFVVSICIYGLNGLKGLVNFQGGMLNYLKSDLLVFLPSNISSFYFSKKGCFDIFFLIWICIYRQNGLEGFANFRWGFAISFGLQSQILSGCWKIAPCFDYTSFCL
jgi:hypothetical protein